MVFVEMTGLCGLEKQLSDRQLLGTERLSDSQNRLCVVLTAPGSVRPETDLTDQNI